MTLTVERKAEVRADAFAKRMYAGVVVQLEDDHRDANGARSWRVLTGPMTGLVRWFKDEHLEPVTPAPPPSTKGDW